MELLFSIKRVSVIVFACLLILLSSFTFAANADLESEIESLKADVVSLNRELFELEEKLLYPATTSFAVFVSLDETANFQIGSVNLILNDDAVSSHVYSFEQVEALRRGGIQKLYQGNLKPGVHQVKAEIMGKDNDGRPLTRTVVADFGKARSTKYLEVKISQSAKKQTPDFAIVEWK